MRATSRLESGLRRLFPFGWGTVTKLTLAYFVSTLYFYVPVGTLYLQSRGLNYFQINSLWGIIVFTMFLAEVPTGLLADRVGHRWAVSAALGFQLVGELVYLFARGYPGFVLSCVAGGVGFAFGSGSVEALVYDALEAQERTDEMTRAVGQIEAGQRLSNLIAFPIGGWLVRNLSHEQFAVAIALTAAAVGAGFLVTFLLKGRPAGTRVQTNPPSSLALLRDGLRLIRHNRAFRSLTILFLATVPFRDYLGSLYQPRLLSAGVPAAWLGITLSVGSGLSFLGARSAHRVQGRLGNAASLLLSTALPGLLYFLLAVAGQPWSAGTAFCLLYGSMSLRRPIFAERLNRHIASQNRATVLSMISMVSGVYVALMGLVFGRIADLSVPLALATIGSIVLAGAVLFRMRRAPPAEA
ncbi:MAG TPA: MFS transporter [Anaerolineae bacterium]|nr:MFS transporter [Anaerolineae bacterium]